MKPFHTKHFRRGFSLIELFIALVVTAGLSLFVAQQIKSNAQVKRIAEVKTNLSQIHQQAMQLIKKFELLELESYIDTNASLKNCFAGTGTNCTLHETPKPAILHTANAALLSPMQKAENNALNGQFTLQGNPCSGASCQVQTESSVSFECASTKCTSAKLDSTVRILSTKINGEDKVLLASQPELKGSSIFDGMKNFQSGSYKREISSTCPVGSAVNVNTQQIECFAPYDLKSIVLNNDFKLSMASVPINLTPGGGNPVLCPDGSTPTGYNPDGTPICPKPPVLCPDGSTPTGYKPDGTPICPSNPPKLCPDGSTPSGYNPDGTPICPDDSCFFWASGAFPLYTSAYIKSGNTGLAFMKVGDTTPLSTLGKVADLIGPGEYPDTYGSKTSPGPLHYGAYLNGLALGRDTRVVIHKGKNFSGPILFDQKGPLVVMDSPFGKFAHLSGHLAFGTENFLQTRLILLNAFKSLDWSRDIPANNGYQWEIPAYSHDPFLDQFPSSTRKWTTEVVKNYPANMQLGNQSLLYLGGYPGLIGSNPEGTSMKVTCNPPPTACTPSTEPGLTFTIFGQKRHSVFRGSDPLLESSAVQSGRKLREPYSNGVVSTQATEFGYYVPKDRLWGMCDETLSSPAEKSLPLKRTGQIWMYDEFSDVPSMDVNFKVPATATKLTFKYNLEPYIPSKQFKYTLFGPNMASDSFISIVNKILGPTKPNVLEGCSHPQGVVNVYRPDVILKSASGWSSIVIESVKSNLSTTLLYSQAKLAPVPSAWIGNPDSVPVTMPSESQLQVNGTKEINIPSSMRGQDISLIFVPHRLFVVDCSFNEALNGPIRVHGSNFRQMHYLRTRGTMSISAE